MTLSNIFFGKKVVQQAYLNNALIYQSNGWQTLPSTCSEVWTKSYDSVSTIDVITKDNNNNVYIGVGNTVYKIDSEGNLKWKCALTTVNAVMITAIVVFPTYIYCSYYVQSDSRIGHISQIDVNGNLLSDKRINDFISGNLGTYFVDMQKDSDYIYVITITNLIKLNSNLAIIDYIPVNYGAHCLTTNNGPYIFVGTSEYGVRFEKNNLKNSISLSAAYSDFNTISITMDNIGNLYLGSSNFSLTLKYDVESCKLLTAFSYSQSYALCTDNQENCYMACSGISLKKVSSDGTLIWDNVKIPTTNNSTKVITDSNGNIYVAYVDSNSMLTIKKFINLVKEN